MSDGSRRETPAELAASDPESVVDPEPASPRAGGFDPTPYIRQLRGRGGGEYLDVKWRLLWLRKEHPDAEIVTELVRHDAQMAIFKATVTLPTGGKATGYGSETASDFPDFLEKAETKAIGRALNALGYGAQFGDAARAEEREPDRGVRAAPSPAPPRPVALPRQEREPAPRPEPKQEPQPEPQPAANQELAAEAPSPAARDPELVEYSWSAFWPWARERGLNGPREIEILIGQPVAGLSPAELRDQILAADTRR